MGYTECYWYNEVKFIAVTVSCSRSMSVCVCVFIYSHHLVKKVIYERYIKRKGNSFSNRTYLYSLKLRISFLYKLFLCSFTWYHSTFLIIRYLSTHFFSPFSWSFQNFTMYDHLEDNASTTYNCSSNASV